MPSLDNLFLSVLREIHFADQQVLKALPRMARAAHHDALRGAFERQQEVAQERQERLRGVFRMLGSAVCGDSSDAMLGLLQDGEYQLSEIDEPAPLHDAGLIACAQAVAYYQMARYQTLVTWAKALARPDIALLLDRAFHEEKATSDTLARLAAQVLGRGALAA
ncbi:YciE/YciF ferroxidase family protein [Roseococcus pinisoli]|uniref:Ferritin-like domain-containing protein n=1 Tax=Roseococcus pinisoli TaxID=2835040 RepID=A0ABS5QAI3_9PROT|nr:DUF892 family protein [Roseococcus pinisoli]MBS7810443.1 ferritin-like domain-containing protein [Roseococcus pinisoli]